MSGVLLGSLLEEAAKRLPKALKPEAVVPTLKKAGVKDEELEISGIGVRLPEYLQVAAKDEKGRVASQDVTDYIEGWRTDRFSSSVTDEAKYAHIIPRSVDPRTQKYKERIYEFKSPNSVSYGSSHFNYSDYLMHTRMWDDELDGVDTRVIGEIQSDLHQNNKTAVSGHDEQTLGYLTKYVKGLKEVPHEQDMYARMLLNAFSGANTNLTRAEMGRKVNKLIEAGITGADNIEQLVRETYKAKPKEAPWKASWMRKGLENEIKQALAEGKQQLAVPIQNTSDLMTKEDIDALAPLVNNFNEVIKNNVGKRENLRDALKAAVPNATQKQKNFLDTVGDLIQDNYDYAPQNTHLQDITSYLSDDYLASYNEIAADAGPGAIGSMVRSDGVQKWYETTVSPTVQKLAKQLGTTAKRVSKDGIDYEVIDLRTPGVKEKADSAFKLYAGGGVLAYYMAMAQGYTPSEISKYMEEQGFSEDEIQDAKANWKKAKEAKKAGKSDEEINAMFGTNMTIKE